MCASHFLHRVSHLEHRTVWPLIHFHKKSWDRLTTPFSLLRTSTLYFPHNLSTWIFFKGPSLCQTIVCLSLTSRSICIIWQKTTKPWAASKSVCVFHILQISLWLEGFWAAIESGSKKDTFHEWKSFYPRKHSSEHESVLVYI